MALRFPAKRVALDIVAGKQAKPVVVEHDGWRILRVTYDQLDDYETCRAIMRQLSQLLRSSADEHPGFDSQVHELHDLVLKRSA